MVRQNTNHLHSKDLALELVNAMDWCTSDISDIYFTSYKHALVEVYRPDHIRRKVLYCPFIFQGYEIVTEVKTEID